MAKKKKSNIKLKKLIQQRLNEAQKEPLINKKTKSSKPMISMKKSPKSPKLDQKNKTDFDQIAPDLKRIGFTIITLIVILVIIFLINEKKPFLNILATKLFELFQKS